jgi:hypothetical protein
MSYETLENLAPRAEVPSTSRFKHLERQPALSALNDTKGVSGAVATPPLNLEPLSNTAEKSAGASSRGNGLLVQLALLPRPGKTQHASQSLGTPWWHHCARAATRKDRS